MRIPPRAVAALLSTALLLSPAAALAQGGASERSAVDATEEARSLVEEAGEAFRSPDYLRALELFRRADALVPRAQLRFNIALCLERLARFREAALEYGAAAEASDLDASARQRAADARARVFAFTAELSIDTGVPDVRVEVDDGRHCQAPCSLVMDPGTHPVIAHYPAGTTTRSVEVSRGTDLRVTLLDPAALADDTPEEAPRRLGWLGFGGLGLTVAGAGTTVGFGLRTRRLHSDFANAPTDATANEGERARLLTNLSLGLALTGLVLFALDLWVLD